MGEREFTVEKKKKNSILILIIVLALLPMLYLVITMQGRRPVTLDSSQITNSPGASLEDVSASGSKPADRPGETDVARGEAPTDNSHSALTVSPVYVNPVYPGYTPLPIYTCSPRITDYIVPSRTPEVIDPEGEINTNAPGPSGTGSVSMQTPKPEPEYVSLTDFGADSYGQKDCSDAFVSAVNACKSKGKNKIYVPAGLTKASEQSFCP